MRRNQAAIASRVTARTAPTLPPTIVATFGVVEAMDAEEDVGCGVEAPILSTIVTTVAGAVDNGEDGIAEVFELDGPCEELVVDPCEVVMADLTALIFSLPETTERGRS